MPGGCISSAGAVIFDPPAGGRECQPTSRCAPAAVDLSSRSMATSYWQLTRLSDRFRLGGDALIAVSLAAAAGGTALAAGGSPLAARLAAVPAAAGLLALLQRRRRPLPVLLAVFAVVFVEELASPHAYQVATFLAVMVATYSLGAHAPKRVVALGVLLGCVGVVIGHSLGKRTHYSDASADVFFIVILVLAPVTVGRVVRARSQLASRLREATERLTAARSERLAATRAADRAQLSESIDAALLEGLGRIVEHAECVTLAQVSALERIARQLLVQLRGLLKDLRAGEEALEPSGPLSELHARVQRAIEAEAALPSAPNASKASPSRWALVSPRPIDAALAIVALVVTAGLLASTLGDHALRGTRWGDALLAVAVAAPLAWARRFALQAAVASVAATFAYVGVAAPADPGSGWLPTGTLIVFPLAIGATCPARKATAGLVLCLGVAASGDAVDPAAKFDPTTIAPGLALVLGAWAAGRVLRDRSRMLEGLADTATRIENELEQLASAARKTERTRVARELHDAVAHAMTVIVLQAGAARRVWSSDPKLASEHSATLRNTVSELITELREMMVALAGGEQAGIDRLDHLLKLAGVSGIHVDLEVGGDRGSLAPALEHTAYRVLQEALTNAARHAPGADILVRLDFGRSGLALEVANENPSPPPSATNGPGHGLRGMRERVEACGGRLATGTGPPGRFTVRAWLPSP
jgi:signal transduction histidine kinase